MNCPDCRLAPIDCRCQPVTIFEVPDRLRIQAIPYVDGPEMIRLIVLDESGPYSAYADIRGTDALAMLAAIVSNLGSRL